MSHVDASLSSRWPHVLIFFMELKGLKWCYPRYQAWFQPWWLRKHHVRPSHVMHTPTSGDGKPSDSSGPTPRWQGCKMEVATILTSGVCSLKTAVMWLRHVETCWYQFEFSVATCSEWFFILHIPSQGLTWSSVWLSPKGLDWISFSATKGLRWYRDRVWTEFKACQTLKNMIPRWTMLDPLVVEGIFIAGSSISFLCNKLGFRFRWLPDFPVATVWLPWG